MMTKTDFIKNYEMNVDHDLAEPVARYIFESLKESILRDEAIFIRGFGSFHIKIYDPNVRRNPRTGELLFKSVRSIRFRPGKVLKKRVDYGKE